MQGYSNRSTSSLITDAFTANVLFYKGTAYCIRLTSHG